VGAHEVKGIRAAGSAKAPVHCRARWTVHAFLSGIADDSAHFAYVLRSQERVAQRLKMMADDGRSSGVGICKTTIHKHLYRAELNVMYSCWIRGTTFETHLRFAAKFTREQRNLHRCKITGGNQPALCDDLVLRVLLSFDRF